MDCRYRSNIFDAYLKTKSISNTQSTRWSAQIFISRKPLFLKNIARNLSCVVGALTKIYISIEIVGHTNIWPVRESNPQHVAEQLIPMRKSSPCSKLKFLYQLPIISYSTTNNTFNAYPVTIQHTPLFYSLPPIHIPTCHQKHTSTN